MRNRAGRDKTGQDAALVVGEALVDVVTRADHTVVEHHGGSAANAAVALARLGRPVRLATALGPDRRGRGLRDHLTASGVAIAGDPVVLPRTSTAAATLAPDGSASYAFDVDWRLDDVATLAGLEPPILMCGSLAVVLEPGAGQVAELLDRLRGRTTVVLDVNARPALTGAGDGVRRRVEGIVARADLVKASDEDLSVLWPDLGPEAAARHLLGLGPTAVVVTRGAAGATWLTAADGGEVPGAPVEVVDTIGAGDTFGAALVDALWSMGALGGGPGLAPLDPEGWRRALTWAARAAAVTVSRPGADPPRRDEVT